MTTPGKPSAGRVRIEPLSFEAHSREYLAAARRSRGLHSPWVAPPRTERELRDYVKAREGPVAFGYAVRTHGGELAGIINLNGIMRGLFQTAFLGYYAFAPHASRGYMGEALSQVLRLAFGTHRLHRVEANIQPDNQASIALVERAGFRREGYSPRYLKIAGRWRDHERWAITVEEWRAQRRPRR
jgi:ribosomal-protein-alanine N-acetyltransferase